MKPFITFFLLLFCINAFCQELTPQDIRYNEKADSLIERVVSGETKPLGELVPLLGDETEFTRVRRNGTSQVTSMRNIALSILYYNCYFKDLPIEETTSSEALKAYLEAHQDEIKYYPHLDRFTDVQVNSIHLPYRIRSVRLPAAKTFVQLKKAVKEEKVAGHFEDMISIFWEIGELRTPQAEKYLLKCADGKYWGMEACDYKEKVLSGIAFALGNFQTQQAFDKLLELYNTYELYAVEDWVKAMARITNVDMVVTHRNYDDLYEKYHSLLEKKGDLEAVRTYGYQDFQVQHQVSNNPIEMVEAIDMEWWVFDNMFQDYLKAQNSMVLYILSRRMVKEIYVYNDKSRESRYNFMEKYTWANMDFDIIEMLQNLTGVTVELEYEGEWLAESDDFEFNLALMSYWKKYFVDYEFNSQTSLFENTNDSVLGPDMIKLYFEQMHTDDDALAMEAYQKLIEMPPQQVISQMRYFDMDYITGRLNRNLPMFTKRFLPQQAYLIEYCRNEGLPYQPTGDLLKVLEEIRTYPANFALQIERENRLAALLTLNNVAAVENYTITYGSRNDKISAAVGHVLDYWYSQQMDSILQDENELKGYLYKAYLFDHLGIVGVVNNYLRKLVNVSPSHLAMIQRIADADSSQKIRENALWVISNHVDNKENETAEGQSTHISFEKFLAIHQDLTEDNISQVQIHPEDSVELAAFFAAFHQETDPDLLFKYIMIMENHLDVSMVPYLLQNFEKSEPLQRGYWGGTDLSGKRHRLNYSAYTKDYVVHFVEKIYDHFNPRPPVAIFNDQFVSSSSSGPLFLWNKHQTGSFWREIWMADSAHFEDWGAQLFDEKMQDIATEDSISHDQVEEIIDSRYWDSEKHQAYLNGVLAKMDCPDRLKIPVGWQIPNYTFEYVTNSCEIAIDQVEKVAKKFYKKDFKEVIGWLKQMILNADDGLRAGDELTSICWNTGVRDSLKLAKYASDRSWVMATLKTYYEQTKSDFDQKFAEVFYLDLALCDLSFKDRLLKLRELDSEGGKEALDRMIRKASYQEVQESWEDLLPLLKEDKNFLEEFADNFHLFISGKEKDNPERLTDVILKNDNPAATLLLLSNYLDLKQPNGDLNYEIIFHLLKYGNTEGFVGSAMSAAWRDYYFALQYYVSSLWKSELEQFAKKEYPDEDYDDREVMLNYMVHKNFVPSEQHKPVSFAHKAVILIR